MDIKYTIVKNEMPASSTEAKYLGRIIPNGVRNREQMTANALATEHFAEATFNAVIDAAISLTQELCAEGRDVDWGPVKFLTKMHGSLPYEDSAFADGTASLTLDADATNTTRAALAELTPTKVSAAEVASLIKVSNVMDVATEQFGTVIADTQFVILGNGLTLDGEGEYAKALDKKTGAVKGTATIQSVSKGQRAYAKFSPQLDGGDYTLEVATKGLIGEASPRIFNKAITAIYIEPTTVAKVTSKTGSLPASPDNVVYQDEHLYISGTKLKLGAEEYVSWTGIKDGAETSGRFTTEGVLQNTDSLLVIDPAIFVGAIFACDDNSSATIKVKGVEKTVTFKTTRPA